MASSMLFANMPNPMIKNSATFIADHPIRQPCSLIRPFLKLYASTRNINNNLQPENIVDPNNSSKKSMGSKLATRWREIQGLHNWENMVEPLHPLLRKEIIRYGELVTACYKGFDLDPDSKRYLNCKYGKRSMLRQVGLGDSGYVVTKYIYATAWPDINIFQNIRIGDRSRWVGYVASSDEAVGVLGRRDLFIAFRGTITSAEWIANLNSSLKPARLDPHDPRPDVMVEAGFLSLYTSSEGPSKFGPGSCREQLLSEVTRLVNQHCKDEEEISITVAGHSMGSSLALLLAYDIAELGLNRPNNRKDNIPITVFSFGGPRVGNLSFKERCEKLGVKVLRVVNVNDPVTKLPGAVFNENFSCFRAGRYEFPWSCASCYAHVGVELMLDFFKMHNLSYVHDLENYMDLLKFPKRDDGGDIDTYKVDNNYLPGLLSQFISFYQFVVLCVLL